MAFREGGGLVPFGGFAPLFGLRREIDRLFDDAWSGRGSAPWVPAVDVRETENDIALDVELPGIKPEEVNVSVDQGVLTISGEKHEERKEGEEGRYHTIERRYGSFTRSFTLPQGVSEDQIEAEFENGVLTVRIPKAALPQPRRIQIGGRAGQTGGRQQVSTGRGRKETGTESSERRVAKGAGEGE